jgi:hypothetical protein
LSAYSCSYCSIGSSCLLMFSLLLLLYQHMQSNDSRAIKRAITKQTSPSPPRLDKCNNNLPRTRVCVHTQPQINNSVIVAHQSINRVCRAYDGRSIRHASCKPNLQASGVWNYPSRPSSLSARMLAKDRAAVSAARQKPPGPERERVVCGEAGGSSNRH